MNMNTILYFYIIIKVFVISVSDAELKRLKDAFKRVSTISGFMTENVFMREVLWDGVPPKIAQVCINDQYNPFILYQYSIGSLFRSSHQPWLLCCLAVNSSLECLLWNKKSCLQTQGKKEVV